LTPTFLERAAAGETLFYESDGHPNPRGYRLIAETVGRHVIAHSARYGLPVAQPRAVSLRTGKEIGE